ncbi:hypothetical protein NDN16_15620 [Aureimonas altamirensis]|uniref:hypothetical protein n=1 Tax=Aureimonas altamirensis TaxID=370622 RepID=UPI002552E9BF|nr:hypothetical protein [Aureimonas altamirensis]MCM2505099.1 hypothetical protein [Aureimonas altamirensis]
MIWRRVVIVTVDDLQIHGFGSKNNVSDQPLTIDHNKYDDFNLENWILRWTFRFLYSLLLTVAINDTDTFVKNLHMMGVAISFGLGPWLLWKTGGYARLSQLPRLALLALCSLIPWPNRKVSR